MKEFEKEVRREIRFDSESHTYWIEGEETKLEGVTSTLLKVLFKDKYKDVNPDVLMKAAEKGSRIHSECEMWDSLGIYPESEEGKNYITLCLENKLGVLNSEFLVSDYENFASAIDKVILMEDSSMALADIKTTYSLDKEYVSWQLSIYKYFFYLTTGEIVDHLYAIWLRGDKAELVEVEDKGTDNVLRLIDCYLTGKEFFAPILSNEEELIRVETELVQLEKLIKFYEDKKKQLSDSFVSEMEKNGIKKFENEHLSITYVPSSLVERFDSAKFKESNPDIYKQYLTVSPRKSSVRIKLK